MAALFYLLFEFSRILLLSFIYARGLWELLKRLRKPLFSYKPLMLVFFAALVIWRFTYWRHSGWGDWGRVPLSDSCQMEIIDYSVGDIKCEGTTLLSGIEKAYWSPPRLYGQSREGLFVFDPSTHGLFSALNPEEFSNLQGEENKLESISNLHANYWGWWGIFF